MDGEVKKDGLSYDSLPPSGPACPTPAVHGNTTAYGGENEAANGNGRDDPSQEVPKADGRRPET